MESRSRSTHPDAPLTGGPAPRDDQGAFHSGTIVLVSLSNPREKFWGAVVEISPAGVSLRGMDLNSFDDFAAMLRADELASPALVFFPMHRVERIVLDSRDGEIPSLSERFYSKSGRSAAEIFGVAELEARRP
jgi:hypothetical protein